MIDILGWLSCDYSLWCKDLVLMFYFSLVSPRVLTIEFIWYLFLFKCFLFILIFSFISLIAFLIDYTRVLMVQESMEMVDEGGVFYKGNLGRLINWFSWYPINIRIEDLWIGIHMEENLWGLWLKFYGVLEGPCDPSGLREGSTSIPKLRFNKF